MNFFTRRRWTKIVKRALHESRHARHMRMDIAPAADLQAVVAAESALQAALDRRDEAGLDAALPALSQAVERVYPPHKDPSTREYVEIIVVAVGVAMGFRTYFIQPFKIPTGSMQPTLYGITVDGSHTRTLLDVFPLNFAKRLTVGERYVEVSAPASGSLLPVGGFDDVWAARKAEGRMSFLGVRRILSWLYGNTPPGPVQAFMVGGTTTGNRQVGGQLCFVHPDMQLYVQPGEHVVKGQRIASGLVRAGDHIFVNRVAYNFRRPHRGDIFVFSTRDIRYSGVRTDNYYIKRLVGLPNEEIGLAPPYLLADGKKVEEPYAFRRMVQASDRGYNGYIFPEHRGLGTTALHPARPRLQLGPGQYLPMGDNTRSSLDGRYFGPVGQEAILGPAFMVYWPFTARWGRVQ